ncbi:MAG: hypothetical protein IJG87_11415 [Ruminococcus sp.]|nr:hypothetical protein [Ruminococcus sp.]
MKAKRIITLALAVILAAMTIVSVSAAQLTETNPGGNTEVTANIQGEVPGNVTYIITIPDVVDFGTLSVPEDDSQDYDRDVTYTVEATEVDGLDTATQEIVVYVKDQKSITNPNDRSFRIANKENSNIEFNYDIYRGVGENVNEAYRVNNGDFFTKGYYLTSFTEEGQTLEGTLRFHQKQLYGRNIADIAGDYSGYMVFFSAIETI